MSIAFHDGIDNYGRTGYNKKDRKSICQKGREMYMANSIIIEQQPKAKGSVWKSIGNWLVYFFILAVYYWFMLPPLNWRSKETWYFILFALILRVVMSGFAVLRSFLTGKRDFNKSTVKNTFHEFSGVAKITSLAAGVIVVFLLLGAVVGFELFNATRYAGLMTMEDGDFSADVAELSMSNIPVVDRDTAARLGLRKLGEISDLVSQFEVDELYYTQINYKGSPYRVTPLKYGDFFKWMNNQSE